MVPKAENSKNNESDDSISAPNSSKQTTQISEKVPDWKLRPPYRMHLQEENFKTRYEASCHCGKVKYQLSRDKPLGSKLCHCTTCQKQHAAPFQWAAIFHKTDINFTHGHHNLEWYDPSSMSIEHTLPCKVRCSFCHCPIMDEGRNMILLFPSLIDFASKEDQEKFRHQCHIFYSQRQIDLPDDAPKWTGLDEKSDLMDEVEQSEGKKRKHRSK